MHHFNTDFQCVSHFQGPQGPQGSPGPRVSVNLTITFQLYILHILYKCNSKVLWYLELWSVMDELAVQADVLMLGQNV